MGGLTQEWRVIWKFSFWSIFTFKTLFSHSTVRRRTAWRARFQGSKAERARGARSVPSLSTLARTPPLPRERVWGFWCAPRRSEGPHEAKFPFNSLSNATRSKISGATGRTNLKIFPSEVFTVAWNPEYLRTINYSTILYERYASYRINYIRTVSCHIRI